MQKLRRFFIENTNKERRTLKTEKDLTTHRNFCIDYIYKVFPKSRLRPKGIYQRVSSQFLPSREPSRSIISNTESLRKIFHIAFVISRITQVRLCFLFEDASREAIRCSSRKQSARRTKIATSLVKYRFLGSNCGEQRRRVSRDARRAGMQKRPGSLSADT